MENTIKVEDKRYIPEGGILCYRYTNANKDNKYLFLLKPDSIIGNFEIIEPLSVDEIEQFKTNYVRFQFKLANL